MIRKAKTKQVTLASPMYNTDNTLTVNEKNYCLFQFETRK